MTSPVLLYDGECGFCDRTVKFAMRRDRSGSLRFATLQGPHGAGVIARHAELANVDSLVWVETNGTAERVWVRSDGALRLATYLGGIWRILGIAARIVPRRLRDASYDAFARRRYRWFGRSDVCELPTEAERARFI